MKLITDLVLGSLLVLFNLVFFPPSLVILDPKVLLPLHGLSRILSPNLDLFLTNLSNLPFPRIRAK